MSEIVRKLLSRKLWMAIAGVAFGVATVLGADTGAIGTVAGAVTALVSAVSYIYVEGRVDAERVKQAVEALQKASDTMKGDGVE